MQKTASHPNDLEKLFIERANSGDVDGLVDLYEPDATIADGKKVLATGRSQIREFFVKYLANQTQFETSMQAEALCSGDIALTSSETSNGDITAEIARRQPDGSWLWIIDQFTLVNRT